VINEFFFNKILVYALNTHLSYWNSKYNMCPKQSWLSGNTLQTALVMDFSASKSTRPAPYKQQIHQYLKQVVEINMEVSLVGLHGLYTLNFSKINAYLVKTNILLKKNSFITTSYGAQMPIHWRYRYLILKKTIWQIRWRLKGQVTCCSNYLTAVFRWYTLLDKMLLGLCTLFLVAP